MEAGADPDTVEVVELDELPLTYMPGGAVRLRAKAVGDLRRESGAAQAGEGP